MGISLSHVNIDVVYSEIAYAPAAIITKLLHLAYGECPVHIMLVILYSQR